MSKVHVGAAGIAYDIQYDDNDFEEQVYAVQVIVGAAACLDEVRMVTLELGVAGFMFDQKFGLLMTYRIRRNTVTAVQLSSLYFGYL